MRRHVRRGPTGRAGRKFAFSCLTGHDCRRDIARYMPTRSGRRGARKMRLKAAARARDRASGASPWARCIVPRASEREKEKGKKARKGKERNEEDEEREWHPIFLLPRYTIFVHATLLSLFAPDSESSCI